MANPRFYCDPKTSDKLALGSQIKLSESAATHATRALRLDIGASVILFNGDGNDYHGELTFIKKNEVIAKIISCKAVNKESPIKITLAQAISSGDRMDFTIQKAVEMGVTEIQPIASQRSVVKLSGERAERRREHWQNVVNSACEQSGRAFVPTVAMPMPLNQWLASKPDAETKITLAPTAEVNFKQLPAPKGNICLLVGAEGGLTEDEITLAESQGFTPVRLGKRILRTETAPLAAIATMQTIWGDFCD
ncbi:16S rRNA (uracil(1498)-N(3))-methyltransferase [Candidatus Methylopumilus turicensis]|uniref:Ribosomal RNA small subunit methyltransferase E n=1 Tax=Candidatus Methylopumilus turicensis TaxID=1581680 RepID=A0A0B7IW60_9PROT|nr:16S rRNA (uracil(1498)-N(3))-methyltransferase [Candidatus Methylopumilus turicensis]CEN56552.1 Ribosomal RNA small subunit methyltransferase E [Candidatus Methylopumilus turicensis]